MIPRQSYAPTPHSYVPNTNLSATINLDSVRLKKQKPQEKKHHILRHKQSDKPCPALPNPILYKTSPHTHTLTTHQFPNLARDSINNPDRTLPPFISLRTLLYPRHSRRARARPPQRRRPGAGIRRALRPSTQAIQHPPQRRRRCARVSLLGRIQARMGD